MKCSNVGLHWCYGCSEERGSIIGLSQDSFTETVTFELGLNACGRAFHAVQKSCSLMASFINKLKCNGEKVGNSRSAGTCWHKNGRECNIIVNESQNLWKQKYPTKYGLKATLSPLLLTHCINNVLYQEPQHMFGSKILWGLIVKKGRYSGIDGSPFRCGFTTNQLGDLGVFSLPFWGFISPDL